jgi:predicted ATPase
LTSSAVDNGLRLQAHHTAWTTCLFAGEPGAAQEHCEAGRRLYNPEQHLAHRRLYGGHDPGVCARYMGAKVHWLLGYPDKALTIGSEALALAEHVAHPLSLEFVLVFNAMLHVDRGEPELALQRLEVAEMLVAEQRLGFVMEPRFLRGAALSAQGTFDEAVACLRDALAGGLGARTFRPYGFTRLAEALASQGQHRAAIAAVREGMEAQEETAALRWGAELHRLEGIALLGLNRLEEAEIALQEALRVARRQQAKAYELRVVTSLARLWGERGRRAEARDLLAPVYGWFTEGFDTSDLGEAKRLIDELA